MHRAPTISWLTICPLGQPEKAIGLEPQIEPWSAISPTVLLVASETEASSRQQHDSAKKETPKSLPTLPRLESRAKIFAPSGRRGVFSLDSPLYRTAVTGEVEIGSTVPGSSGRARGQLTIR